MLKASFIRRVWIISFKDFVEAKRGLSGQSKDYSEYFMTLKISEDSDQFAAREAFLKLAKIYHPDSGHSQANGVEFQKIENAYRKCLEKFRRDRESNDCEGEFGLYYEEKKGQEESEDNVTGKFYDIKHTAPQHRQYLSYEGIGIGTPSQREKQFSKFKAMRAAENIIDYKVQQLSQDQNETGLVSKDKKAARNIRTRYGIDRLVEDKIQESMARGDFDNLPNAGKPLKFQNHNPFVDVVTHKMNQVLIENGYAPEWVMLEREMRDDKIRIKKKLEVCRSKLGPVPLSKKDEMVWTKLLSSLSSEVVDLNKKVDKYNFVVPIMTKQTVHFSLNRASEKILKEGKSKEQYEDDRGKSKEQYEDDRTQSVLENESHGVNTLTSKPPPEKFGFKAIIAIFKER